MELIIRATFLYLFLWLVARGTGKRELSEMTAFELILLVTMGDLIQQGVTQEDMSVIGAFLAVGTLAFWILVFGYLGWKFPRFRPAIEGVPVVVLRDGEPLDEVLKLERLTLDELCESARNQGIDDLAKVKIAVLEPDGKFSFLRVRDVDDAPHPPEKHIA
ncbi:MAG TPA: YetF domain-containing protein, partial [Acidimicrobiales bacterium]